MSNYKQLSPDTIGYTCEDCGQWVPHALPADYDMGTSWVRFIPICIPCDEIRLAEGAYGDWEPSCDCKTPCWGIHP